MDALHDEREVEGPSWDGPAIGLLDLDSFFASVEQLDHPSWRGRPVIVGGDADRRGVVSTASYEARAYGVHSAMPAATARRLCPDAIWTHGHFDRYREMSDKVMQVLVDETPYVEQVSIDEAFFDVTPGRFARESPILICRRMQACVRDLGITCSIGLGTSKSVAKIASEHDKPRGLTAVLPGSEAEFLHELPVRAMSGIGPAAESRLAKIGIHTLGQLACADEGLVRSALGSSTVAFMQRASGTERSEVARRADKTEVKSVSNERTYATDIESEEDVRSAVAAMATMVGRRLRRKRLMGTCVTVRIRYDLTHSSSAQVRLAHATDDEGDFGPAAQALVDKLWRPGMRARLVGVAVSGFSEQDAAVQLGLFDEEPTDSQRELHATLDEVRERFGDDALELGRDIRLKGLTTNTAPQHKEDT